MVKTVSVRKLRQSLAGVLKDVTGHMDRYVITNRGEPAAMLMCVDDYEGWLETLEIMSDKEALADIRAAKKELAGGKGLTFDRVFPRHLKTTKR